MFYLEKCKKCTRSGSVALEQNDKLCNLCKGKKDTKEDEGTEQKERDQYGRFVEDKKED